MAATLRFQGVRIVIYLDDMIFLGQQKDVLMTQVQDVVDSIMTLGFIISENNSDLPSGRMDFLGFLVDSEKCTFLLPDSKLKIIRKDLTEMLAQTQIFVKQLVRMVVLLFTSI